MLLTCVPVGCPFLVLYSGGTLQNVKDNRHTHTCRATDKDIPDVNVWKKLIVQVVSQLNSLLASVVDMLCMRAERLVIRALTFVFLAFYIIDQVYFCEQWTIILNKLTYQNLNSFTPQSKK